MPAPAVAAVAAAPAIAQTVQALTHPIFRIETSGVHARRGKKGPIAWNLALHPSLLDIGLGAGALLAAYAFYLWVGGRPLGLPSLFPPVSAVPGAAPLGKPFARPLPPITPFPFFRR